MNKPFWIFAYDQYYPGGGMNDFMGAFDSYEDADKFIAWHKADSRFCSYTYYDIQDITEQQEGFKSYDEQSE